MPIEKKSFQQIVGEMLKMLSESSEEFVYSKNVVKYRLPGKVIDVVSVEGVVGGSKRTFTRDVDYRFSENNIEWVYGGVRPDDGTKFIVTYKPERAEITDTSPGSVVRTILEAIGREIEYLNLLIEQAYYSGFIDTSSGEALDLVVAILGMRRKPPQPASGYVTFGRRSEPETIQVNGEIIFYDGSTEYSLKNRFVKEVSKVKGISESAVTEFRREVDYTVYGNRIRWLPAGKRPDEGTTFTVDYTAYREISVPKGTRVSTYSTKPEEVIVYTTVEQTILKPTQEGSWEADVPVVCAVPGPKGNVLAGAITVLPQPLVGVEYVINKVDVTGGVDAESDRELRDRAKRALEIAGKATLPSIETTIKSVEGVSSVLVKEAVDNVPGILKVIVDGGDPEKIVEAIEKTRAAGIKVEFARPKPVYVDVNVTLVLEKWASEAEVSRKVEEKIRGYLSSLKIGEDVLFYKIASLALDVEGVKDVAEIVVEAYRGAAGAVRSERENIVVSDEEKVLARNIRISYRRIGYIV
jgi:uncharacterized phage protein gp47/JayE